MTAHRKIALCGFFFMAVGCGKKEAHAPKLETFPVRVQSAAPRTLEDSLMLVGTLKAKDEATLFSRVPGKLMQNLMKEGDRVSKGQPVALVERDEVGVKFEPAPVPSTLDGVVGRVYLDRGANVTLNTPVALVADTSEVYVQVEVPERYMGKVAAGQDVRVQIESQPDSDFRGRIIRASPVVDPITRSAYAEARLENRSGHLRPGMFAKVRLVVAKRENVVAVPVESLVDGSGPSVFVVQDGKAVKREVQTGLQTDQWVEVGKGVSPGENVVTFGIFGLTDGSPVEIIAPQTPSVESAQ